MKIKKIVLKIQNNLLFISRKRYFAKIRAGVTDKDLFLVSNDCISGIIYHQLGKKFCSPFINLYIPIKDFFVLMNNFKEFMSSELFEDKNCPNPFPVGYLENKKRERVRVKFMHYQTFELAKTKWEERLARFDFDHYICILNCSAVKDRTIVEEYFNEFKKVSAPRKMFFSTFDFDSEFAYKFDFNNKKKTAIDPKNRLIPYRRIVDSLNYKEVFKK